jgi:ribonuclease Y
MVAQKFEELQRKQKEVDAIRDTLTTQMELVDKRTEELERMHRESVEKLEALSGLSAEEAKPSLLTPSRPKPKLRPCHTSTRLLTRPK